MDEIVKAAMAKWPNVPHCYGWLALDARGQWRMRDERCQSLQLPGDIIRHPTLIDFIHRNYSSDERGCWYFQNGPQRVYVDLDATPYIARTIDKNESTTDDLLSLQLHTQQAMPQVIAATMDADGHLVLASEKLLALVDDRDLAQVASHLQIDGHPVSDETLFGWLESEGQHHALTLRLNKRSDEVIAVQFSTIPLQMAAYRFISHPQPQP